MEARITRKTAALAIFLISAFQTYIYAGRPSSCQLLIINSYTENCLWSDDFMAPVYKEFRVQNSPVDICAEHMELMATVVPDMRKQVFMSDRLDQRAMQERSGGSDAFPVDRRLFLDRQ